MWRAMTPTLNLDRRRRLAAPLESAFRPPMDLHHVARQIETDQLFFERLSRSLVWLRLGRAILAGRLRTGLRRSRALLRAVVRSSGLRGKLENSPWEPDAARKLTNKKLRTRSISAPHIGKPLRSGMKPREGACSSLRDRESKT